VRVDGGRMKEENEVDRYAPITSNFSAAVASTTGSSEDKVGGVA